MMRRSRFVFGTAAAAFSAVAARWRSAGCDAEAVNRETRDPLVRVRVFSGIATSKIGIASEQQPMSIRSLGRTHRETSVFFDVSAAESWISSAGTLGVTAYAADGSTVTRRYEGTIHVVSLDGNLLIVNTVPIEPYVESVMASEISPRWSADTLRAQAIAVRTYALARMRTNASSQYDVTDGTANQVYHGIDGIVAPLSAAAQATAGMALLSGDAPADVWYHSACGGHTAAPIEITGNTGPPYLGGIADIDASGRAFCADSPYYRWRNTIAISALAEVFDSESRPIASLAVVDRWTDGRVRTLRASYDDGKTSEMDGHAFYARAGARLGYKVVPSAFFDVAPAAPGFAFTGHGVGHGVGMCQWGAQGRARAGFSAEAILSAYFPGTRIGSM